MAIARAILEMGIGNDLHGKDYTKAAVRAVKDAMHHSSLHFLKSFDLDRKSIIIHVKIGVQDPKSCLLYTSPSPRDLSTSRMPSSA